jgi:multicomponent K+:H+ antiporter subunit A
MTYLIPLAVLTLFLGSLAVALAAARNRQVSGWLAGATMALSLGLLVPLMPEAFGGEALIYTMPWLPDWGLNLSFRFDGLGLLFSLLILGIGLLIVLYAVHYLPDDDNLIRFFSTLLAFAGGMLGVVLAENIIMMVVFWEITGLTSFLLIAYKHTYHEGRIGARMALAVTGGGGLALLVGALMLGNVVGSFELSAILAAGDQVRAHPQYPIILVLILLGAFTKSAQFPFHFWLPHAMAAPTPVSAYLHSATMVKAGIFLLGRLYPALAGTDLWFVLVAGTGAVTFAYAGYLALLKDDLKSLLAYSTVSHLGLITLLFGLNTPMAAVAAVFHIINHAIFKACLFMAAGVIDKQTGTRDLKRISGLYRFMPQTAFLGILAALSMAGLPFLNGFLSKEMFFTEAVDHPLFGASNGYLLPIFATVAGALSVAYSVRFIHDIFFNGEPNNLPKTPVEPPRMMRVPMEILIVLVVAIGVLPQLVAGPLLTASAGAVLLDQMPPVKIAIWHGFNLPLVMSIIAVLAGVIYYFNNGAIVRMHEIYGFRLTSPVAFERVYNDFARFSRLIYGLVDTASLQRSLLLIVASSVAAGAWAWSGGPQAPLGGGAASTHVDPISAAALAVLIISSLGIVVLHQQRFLSIIFLSVVGLIVSFAFVRFSAPDLALTQLSVEVVSIILLLLALRYVPAITADQEPLHHKIRDGLVAGASGLAIGTLCYAMLTRPFETISGYFVENALPGGGGTNVVNVILVDFRGFDTLGEIAVLALAALGAHALLSGLKLQPHTAPAASDEERHPTMLMMLMRPMLPLTLVVSFYILLRGHNLPGGGFIAGLITGVALVLQYAAAGITFATERIRVRPTMLFAWGLGLAGGVGVVSMMFGFPFLTSAFGYVYPPGIGKTELASAMIFDVGVYLIVVGAVLLMLTEIGKLSRRDGGLHSSEVEPVRTPAEARS